MRNNQPPSTSPAPTWVMHPSPDSTDHILSAPSHEAVAALAYATYVSEGSPAGRDRQHWFAAEAALLAGNQISFPQSSSRRL